MTAEKKLSTSNVGNGEYNQEFLNQMLQKCEAKSFGEIYIKLLTQRGDVVRCEDLFAKDAKLTPERIQKDVVGIPEIINIQLFDPRQPVIGNNQGDQFKRLDYVVNLGGLVRVIHQYRKAKTLTQDVKWTTLLKIWGIQQEEQSKLKTMIDKIITEKLIYAELSEKPELTLHFMSLMEIPEKRRKVFELAGVSAIFVGILTLLIVLLKFTNFF